MSVSSRSRNSGITTHLYSFYVLMVAILLHIVGVVVTEVREKNGLTSAMFSGEKALSEAPVDAPTAVKNGSKL